MQPTREPDSLKTEDIVQTFWKQKETKVIKKFCVNKMLVVDGGQSMKKCKYAEEGDFQDWKCTLGYWNGRTTAKQCQICMALGRNNKETADAMRANPKERWKMNSYSPSELDTAINKVSGFGDIIHKFAQPIAVAIDKIFKTNVKNCGSCKKRQEKLNKMFPLRNPYTNELPRDLD